jgi:hypothetical protein
MSPLSASFGVTEYIVGESPSSFFMRADQALLRAKEEGRNRVVLGQQVERGLNFVCQGQSSDEWLPTDEALLQQLFISHSPFEVVTAKLDCFVQEQQAEMQSGDKNRIVIHTGDNEPTGLFRRTNDRRAAFKIDLQFKEICDGQDPHGRSRSKTRLQITVCLLRQRDRRLTDVKQQADLLMRALVSFLMLQPAHAPNPGPEAAGREST